MIIMILLDRFYDLSFGDFCDNHSNILFLWTVLLIVLAKFFNYKWKVMEFETKRHIEAFFKEKEDKGERRINRTK